MRPGFPPQALAVAPGRPGAGSSSRRSVTTAVTLGLLLLPRLPGLLLSWLLPPLLLPPLPPPLLLLPLLCPAPLSLPVPTWAIQVRVTASPPLAGSLQAALLPRQKGAAQAAERVRKTREGRFPGQPLPARSHPVHPGSARCQHTQRGAAPPNPRRFRPRSPQSAKEHGFGSKNLRAKIWLPDRLKKKKKHKKIPGPERLPARHGVWRRAPPPRRCPGAKLQPPLPTLASRAQLSSFVLVAAALKAGSQLRLG